MVLAFSSADGRNLLTPAVCAAGIEALNTAADSAEVDAVVITGTGNHFSRGEDLEALQALLRARTSAADTSFPDMFPEAGWEGWIEAIATFPKPVLAAVDGTAAGAGTALAMACDLIVATSNAAFSMPHGVLGLLPAAGAIWHAVRSLPPQLATELLLGGASLTAPRLQAAGLVNRIVSPGAARAEAVAWAARLGSVPMPVMADIKELMGTARQLPLDAQLVRERSRYLHHLHRAEMRDVLTDAINASDLSSLSPTPWMPHS